MFLHSCLLITACFSKQCTQVQDIADSSEQLQTKLKSCTTLQEGKTRLKALGLLEPYTLLSVLYIHTATDYSTNYSTKSLESSCMKVELGNSLKPSLWSPAHVFTKMQFFILMLYKSYPRSVEQF